LDFRLNGLRIFFFHLANTGWFAGYRCSGGISLINGLIGAWIAGESGILPRFFWNSGKFVVAMPIVALDRILAST